MWYSKYLEDSLRMIKVLKVKNEEEYSKIVKNYKVLNLESLKYLTHKDFDEILKLAETKNSKKD